MGRPEELPYSADHRRLRADEKKQLSLDATQLIQDLKTAYPTPQHLQRKQTRSLWTRKLSIVAGVAVLSLVAWTAYSSHRSLESQLESVKESVIDFFGGYGSDSTEFRCAGRGVVTTEGRCLCDLGWAGPECTEQIPISSTPSREVTPNSVCLVTEHLGPLCANDEGKGLSQAMLAQSLTKSGYEVTVVYIGPSSPTFSKVQADFREKGISVVTVPSIPLELGPESVERRSYEVYQYLSRSPKTFSHVIFSGTSGSGYYTLQAQRQGLFCSDTKFIVGMDALSQGRIERVMSGDPSYMPVDPVTLKLDFLSQKSLELADVVVFSSDILVNEIKKDNWVVFENRTRVITPTPSVWKKSAEAPTTKVPKELVFVGPMNNAGGLVAFCDAIDLVVKESVKTNVKVTFLGAPSTINDMSSEEYIELRAQNWESYGLQWSIRSTECQKTMLDYMTVAGSDRVAVIPSEFDATATVAQMMFYSGVPFIGSTTSAIKDVIDDESRNKVLSAPNGLELALKLRAVLGGTVPFAIAPVSGPHDSVTQWQKIFMEPKTNSCPTKFDDAKEKPLVSVVIVHHNRLNFLKQAIESLYKQTYRNIEVILVDDGSTDTAALEYMSSITWNWWSERGWKILREPNRYLGAARNTGLKNAAGKYVLFIDDDDYSKPHHVETLIRVAVNTNASVVTAGHDTFSGPRRPALAKPSRRQIPIGNARLVGMLENVFGDSAMMVQRDWLIGFGGFSEDRGVGFEDYELFARVAVSDTYLEAVAEPLHWYRRHSRSMSSETNLKANQLRALRPYVATRPVASEQELAVLEYTQTLFFKRFASIAIEADRVFFRAEFANSTNLKPVPKPVPVKPPSCDAFFDQTGSSGVAYTNTRVWFNDVGAWCWDFGSRSALGNGDSFVRALPLLAPVYESGNAAGKLIFGSIPCKDGYSDAWIAIQVVVDDSYPIDHFKDYASLFLAAKSSKFFDLGYFNYPIVPPNSNITDVSPNQSPNPPSLLQGWFENSPVYYFDLGEITGVTAGSNNIATSVEVEIVSNNTAYGSSVVSTGQGQGTGFYALNFVDVTGNGNYDINSFRSISQFGNPYNPYPEQRISNCPITYTDLLTNAVAGQARLDGVDPEVIPNLSSVYVVLSGAGFSSSSVIRINEKEVPRSKFTLLSNSIIVVDVDVTEFPGDEGFVSVYVDASVSYSLRYYSSSDRISTIAASDLLTDTDGQLVELSGVFPTTFTAEGAVCVFNATENGVITPASYVNASLITCPFPVIENSGQVSVNLMMSQPKFDVPENSFDIPTSAKDVNRPYLFLPIGDGLSTFATSSSTNTFNVLKPAPKLSAAQFSETGSSIFVDLDSPANLIDYKVFESSNGQVTVLDTVSSPVPCSAMFLTSYSGPSSGVPAQLARDGSPTDCTVQQLTPTRFLITVDSRYVMAVPNPVVPLNLLMARKNALWAYDASLSETSDSSVVIKAPSVIPAPLVTVSAPSYLSACADLTIDLSAVSGSLGRQFTSASSVTFSSQSNMAGSSQYSQLQNALNTGFSNFLAGSQSIVIPANLLWTSQDPSRSSESYIFTFTLVNFLKMPTSASFTVTKVNDNSAPYINLLVPSTPRVGAPISIIASALPICGLTDKILYKWSIAPEGCPGLTIPDGLTGSELVIAPFTIQPQTSCNIRLSAKYSTQSTWFQYTAAFATATESMVVTAGPSRTVGYGQAFILTADVTDDSYPSNVPSITCAWTCTVNGHLCDASVISQLTACSGNRVSGLSSGEYSFGVTVTNTATSVSASSSVDTVVTVQNAKVPIVSLKPSTLIVSAASESFTITSSVDPTTVISPMDSLIFSWSRCARDDVGVLDLTKPANLNVDLTNPRLQSLSFSRGALKASTQYCFGVTVTDPKLPAGYNGYAEYTFKTRDAPQGGYCAFASGLQYQCSSFSTDRQSYPIKYSFYASKDGVSNWKVFRPNGYSASVKIPVSLSGYYIKAEINDAAGSVGSWSSASQSSSSSSLRRDSSAYVSSAAAAYTQTLNTAEAEKALAVSAMLTAPGSVDYSQIVSFAQNLVSSPNVYIDTSVHGPIFASILSSLAGSSYSLDSYSINAVSNLAGVLIKNIKAAGKTEVPVNCVNSASSLLLLSSLDQLIGSQATSSPVDRVSFLGNFESILTDVETCIARRLPVQAKPLTYSSNFLSRSVGVANPSLDSNFCSFSVPTGQIQSNSVSYGCGIKAFGAFPATTSFVAVNPSVQDLTFRDLKSESPVSISLTTFGIPIASSADSAYGLSSYVIPANGGFDTTHTYEPVCAFYAPGAGSEPWSTSGCSALNVTGGTVFCQCNHLTDFAVVVAPVGFTSGGSGGLNIGAIIGGVLGAVALILLIVAIIYFIRRSQAKKNSMGDSSLPTHNAYSAAIARANSEKGAAKPNSKRPSELQGVMIGSGAVGATVKGDEKKKSTVNRPKVLPAYLPPPSYEQHIANKNRS